MTTFVECMARMPSKDRQIVAEMFDRVATAEADGVAVLDLDEDDLDDDDFLDRLAAGP